jgi:excisionase family DNA binding protein
MTGRSGRGRWERALSARRQAQTALGRDPNSPDLYATPPKAMTALPKAPTPTFAPRHPSERVEYVLSLGEAAARLSLSRTTLEAMIDAGRVEAVPTGFTRMIPTREVERLTKGS